MNIKDTIIFFILLSLSTAVYADTLILSNGSVVECVVLDEKNERITVAVSGGTMTFRAAEIKEIERDEQTENHTLQQRWNTELVRQQDKTVHRRQQAREKSNRIIADREKNNKDKIVKKVKKRQPVLDIRKPKEKRSGWGRIEKSDWDEWGAGK